MDIRKRLICVSNSYYNQGLERAGERDLTGAVESLKKSVHFNKFHTDARNLLGLVFYEMGEVAEALVQWVISMNMQPDHNAAGRYLEEVQGNPRQLEAAGSTIKRFNQALGHAQSGSDDLAALQLRKVVDANPNYVKAELLLAVLYLRRGEYHKAEKPLTKVLQVDRHNPKALWYAAMLKEGLGRAEQERPRGKGGGTRQRLQMPDDDVIVPPTYKENTGWQTVWNIVTGLCLGAAVIFFLVMPTREMALNNEHNQELGEYVGKLGKKDQEIRDLNAQIEELTVRKDAAESSLASIEGDNGNVIGQYQTVVGILQAYRNDDFENAVKLYAVLNPALITDENVQAIIAEVKQEMDEEGWQVLEKLGDTSSSAGDGDAALDYYQKSLNIKPDNPEVMLKMGMVHQNREEKDAASQIFGELIKNFPDSEQAEQAKAIRGF